MKVYIELVILDNLVMTSSIAGLSYASLGMRVHKRRTAVAAVCGTVVSIFYPFWDLATVLLIVAKITVGVLLGLILFARLEKPLVGIVVFFLHTAVMGGICILINYLITGDIGEALTGVPALPYAVPSAVGAVAFFLFRFVLRAAKRKRQNAAYRFDVDVTVAGRTARMRGYLDTGNGLYDEETSRPVVVVKYTSLAGAFGKEWIEYRFSGEKTVETVSGQGKLFLLKPDKFILYSGKNVNTNKDVMLGVTKLGFKREEDMLLHPSVMGG